MKKVALLLGSVFLSVFLCTGIAMAIPIVGDLAVDFRHDSWLSADEGHSFNPTGSDVTATAFSISGNDKLLFQAKDDGLGIRGGEEDEIDPDEYLEIVIGGGGMLLSGFWLTDLFKAPDGGEPGETGWVVINDNASKKYSFTGIHPLGVNNGELSVTFSEPVLVEKAEFYAHDRYNNEYSVAGFTAPVPEPATMLLLGTGLIGLAAIGRRKFFKK